MAIVANATTLGLKDFTTISNYALSTAESIGLTADAYFALSGAMSKVGLNASTIGTSIRRLKKFTDSTADSIKHFFRILGTNQDTFTKAIRGKGGEKEMVKFTRQLAKMSEEHKDRYKEMTKDLNVFEKSTIDSLAAIGKGDYFKSMLNGLELSAKGMKILETQAKEMSSGLIRTFNRIQESIKQSFNKEYVDFMKNFFDSSSADAMTASIEAFVDKLKGVIRVLAEVAAAFVAYKVAIFAANTAYKTGQILLGAYSLAMALFRKNAIATTMVMDKFRKMTRRSLLSKGIIGAAVFVAIETYIHWTNKATEATERLNEEVKRTKEEFASMSKQKLATTMSQTLKDMSTVQGKIDTLKKELLSYANNNTTIYEMFFGENELEYKKKATELEQLTTQLKIYTDAYKKMQDVARGRNKNATELNDIAGYDYSEKELAAKQKTEDINALISTQMSEREFTYKQLLALLNKENKELEEIQKKKFTEGKQALQNLKVAEANLNIKKFEKKLLSDLVASELAKNKAINATKASLGEISKYEADINDIKARQTDLNKREKEHWDRYGGILARASDEIKKTYLYKIALNEQNKLIAEKEALILEKNELVNAEVYKTQQLLVDAVTSAYNLSNEFATMANEVASVTRELDVMLGKMSQGSAGISNAQDVKKIADMQVHSAKVQLELAEEQQKSAINNKDTDEIERTKAEVMSKKAEMQRALTNQKIASMRIDMASVTYAQEQTKQFFEQEKLLVETNSLKGKILDKDARAVKAIQDAQKQLRINIKEAKANYSISSSEENRLAVIKAENALTASLRKEKEKILDIASKSSRAWT